MKFFLIISYLAWVCMFIFMVTLWWETFKTSEWYQKRNFKYPVKIKVSVDLPATMKLIFEEDDTLVNIKKELDIKQTKYIVETKRKFSSETYPDIYYSYTLRFKKEKDRLAFQLKHCNDGSILDVDD